MIRTLLASGLLALTLAPAHADETEKQTACRLQAELVGAVQQARLDRVRKAKLTETLRAANPDWSEGMVQAIPAIGDYVYSFKRRELRGVDLAATSKQQCLENWDQIQDLKNSMSN